MLALRLNKGLGFLWVIKPSISLRRVNYQDPCIRHVKLHVSFVEQLLAVGESAALVGDRLGEVSKYFDFMAIPCALRGTCSAGNWFPVFIQQKSGYEYSRAGWFIRINQAPTPRRCTLSKCKPSGKSIPQILGIASQRKSRASRPSQEGGNPTNLKLLRRP